MGVSPLSIIIIDWRRGGEGREEQVEPNKLKLIAAGSMLAGFRPYHKRPMVRHIEKLLLPLMGLGSDLQT